MKRARRSLIDLSSCLTLLLGFPLSACACSGGNKCIEVDQDIIPRGFYEVLGVFFLGSGLAAMDTALPGYLAVGPGHPGGKPVEISYWAEDGKGGAVERSIEAYPNAVQNRGRVHPECPPAERKDFDNARLWLDRGNGMEEVTLYADVVTGMHFIDWLFEGNSESNPLDELALKGESFFPGYALPLEDYRHPGDQHAEEGWLRILFPVEGGWGTRPEGSSLGEPKLVVHDSSAS